MAAPATGEAIVPQETSDLQRPNDQSENPNSSLEVNLTIAQLSKSKTSPSPPLNSWGKRRKMKPKRYGVSPIDVKTKKNSPSKLKFVVRDPSSTPMSSQDENSAAKDLNTPSQRWPALIRAREVQSNLGTEHPSCIKLMVKSHVTNGFWMGLPLPFCKLHMPKTDTWMVLEDENGAQFELKYIANKTGLSAGWKKFAASHNLLEGDVLVLHLVGPFQIKVYIVRANDLNEVDGALSLLNLDAHTERATPETITTPLPKPKKVKRPKSLPLTEVQKKQKISTSPSEPAPQPQISTHPVEHSGNDSEDVGSEILEGSRPSKPNLMFQEIKAFKDFSIIVNGRCIDSELPDEVRMSYYKLCLAKNEFLHNHLPEGMYYKLGAGMIGESVSIANDMKNCKLNTTKEEFEAWDNSLKSFELLGMKVDFLRERVKVLARLASESEGRLYVKRYAEAKNEQKRMDEEIKTLEEKVRTLKEGQREFEGVMDGLKQEAESFEVKFKQEVDAAW